VKHPVYTQTTKILYPTGIKDLTLLIVNLQRTEGNTISRKKGINHILPANEELTYKIQTKSAIS
jgi:hypothetical protein